MLFLLVSLVLTKFECMAGMSSVCFCFFATKYRWQSQQQQQEWHEEKEEETKKLGHMMRMRVTQHSGAAPSDGRI